MTSFKQNIDDLRTRLEEKFLNACFGTGFSPKTKLGKKAWKYLEAKKMDYFQIEYADGKLSLTLKKPTTQASQRCNYVLDVIVLEYHGLSFNMFKNTVEIHLAPLNIFKERIREMSPEHKYDLKKAVKYLSGAVYLGIGTGTRANTLRLLEYHLLNEDFINAVLEAALIQKFLDETVPTIFD